MNEPRLRRGVYYVRETNNIIILAQIMKTLVMDMNGIDHRAWVVTIESDKGRDRGYIHDTSNLVYLGGL